jgi:hypothetical protein
MPASYSDRATPQSGSLVSSTWMGTPRSLRSGHYTTEATTSVTGNSHIIPSYPAEGDLYHRGQAVAYQQYPTSSLPTPSHHTQADVAPPGMFDNSRPQHTFSYPRTANSTPSNGTSLGHGDHYHDFRNAQYYNPTQTNPYPGISGTPGMGSDVPSSYSPPTYAPCHRI